MEDLKLEKNEGILLLTTEAWRYFDDNVLAVDILYLTNQNLISVYEKTKGIFSEQETVIDKVPLTSISIINDAVQVKKVIDDDYGDSLQIIFDDGKKELLQFTESPKKEYQQWKVAISNAVLECNRKRNTDNQDETIVQNSPVAEINETVNLNTKEIRFCSFCGTKLGPGARFCKSCGTPLETVKKPEEPCKEEQYQQSTYSERKQEYAGKIIKCPVCGQELSSTDAICPSCGHEMNQVRIHPILEKFISELNECDFNIAQEEIAATSGALKKKLGWSSWKMPVKVLWVVLNCFILCAPLVLYYVAIKNRHNDTPNTNIKRSLIGNFHIPNEREAVIATLNFIRGKVIALTSQKITKETRSWIKLWSAKASQIHKQAIELLPNDVIVENIYRDIVLEVRKAKKTFNNKVLLKFFLVVIYIAVICCFDIFLLGHIFHGNFGSSNKAGRKDEKETVKWSDMILSEYFPEPVLTNAYVYSNSKEECDIGEIECSQSEYYEYCRQCKEWGFDYEIVKEDDTWFTAYNSEGYKVHMAYIGSDLSVELNAPMEMSDFNWPESEIGQIVPVPQSTYGKISWEYDSGFLIYIGNMSQDDFSEYAILLHESGFNIDVRKGDYYFRADNADGYHISIEYEGFNIVWLRADAPDDE